MVDLDGMEMSFPCPPYAEQEALMREMKASMDKRENLIVEMPPGTGGITALTSFLSAYSRNTGSKVVLAVRSEKERARAEERTDRERVRVVTHADITDPRTSHGGDFCVIDDGYDIDQRALHALSMEITRNTLDSAWKSLVSIEGSLDPVEAEEEYERIKRCERECIDERTERTIPPSISERSRERETWSVPGNLRKPKDFLGALKRMIEFMKMSLKKPSFSESLGEFVSAIGPAVFLDTNTLSFFSARLARLLRKRQAPDLESVCDFSSVAAQFESGFFVEMDAPDVEQGRCASLRLLCVDPAIAFEKMKRSFGNIILVGSSIFPQELQKALGIETRFVEIPAVYSRFLPMIVTKGSDQMRLTFSQEVFEKGKRPVPTEPAILRNYGSLLLEFSKVVPDGIVCLLPTMARIEEALSAWADSGVLMAIMKNKLIFLHRNSSSMFNHACETGRGAIFIGVPRDLDDVLVGARERAILIAGLPYEAREKPGMLRRVEFMGEKGLREEEYHAFDSMRHASHCAGRAIEKKSGRGVVLFADREFDRNEKKSMFPRWIQRALSPSLCNLSIDMAVLQAKRFFRSE
jgi:DNA excision repair protein ERCC-2